jgi:uncharacterized surface protein with fasciclin (FAS1) repeats
LQASGLAANFTNDTAVTILAPDNAAFISRLNESLGITPSELLLPANRETLIQVSCAEVVQFVIKGFSCVERV